MADKEQEEKQTECHFLVKTAYNNSLDQEYCRMLAF